MTCVGTVLTARKGTGKCDIGSQGSRAITKTCWCSMEHRRCDTISIMRYTTRCIKGDQDSPYAVCLQVDMCRGGFNRPQRYRQVRYRFLRIKSHHKDVLVLKRAPKVRHHFHHATQNEVHKGRSRSPLHSLTSECERSRMDRMRSSRRLRNHPRHRRSRTDPSHRRWQREWLFR